MEIVAGDSKLRFDEAKSILVIEGSMRLANLSEYEPVKAFIVQSSEKCTGLLTIDMQKLEFLNSSGITTISTFVLGCKKHQKPRLKIIGSNLISWQEKSLSNLINFGTMWKLW